MREFNLEEAKAGKPVCTRDGRDVKILDFDYQRIDTDEHFLIVKMPSRSGRGEVAMMYLQDGIPYNDEDEDEDKILMLQGLKYKGFVNIYRNELGCNYPLYQVFDCITKEQAQDRGKQRQDYITTVEIEWED